MSKKIKSPIERWPGFIILPDPLTYPQLIRIQDMMDAANEEKGKSSEGVRMNNAILPYLFELCEEFSIEGIEKDPDQFPAQPLEEVNQLIDWWYLELVKPFIEEKPKN